MTKPKEIAPEIESRYVSWASNVADEEFSFLVSRINWESSDRVVPVLFELHMMYEQAEDLQKKFDLVREWAYGEAVNHAMYRKIRYGLQWGRQAALDGAFLGMWPNEKSGAAMPSVQIRAIQFGISGDNYQIIRKHVQDRAVTLINDYGDRLQAAFKSAF